MIIKKIGFFIYFLMSLVFLFLSGCTDQTKAATPSALPSTPSTTRIPYTSTTPTQSPLIPTPYLATPSRIDERLQIDYASVIGKGPNFFGVEYGWVDQAADLYLERIARLHANTIRVQITQDIFEPVNDNLNPNISEITFSQTFPINSEDGTTLTYEEMFKALINADPDLNFQINMLLAARWNATNDNGYFGMGGTFPPLDINEHKEFIRELARWLVHTCGIPANQLKFTFINEPNLNYFFTGTTEDLVDLATATRYALDEISPEIEMGGLDEVHSLDETNLFYPRRPVGCCDFWTFHIYEQGVERVWNSVLNKASQLQNYGPVWVTEFADTANGSPDAQMDFSSRSAALGFAEMAGHIWGSNLLDGLIHFRLSDMYVNTNFEQLQGWTGHGLFADAQGTHAQGEPYAIFPAYYVFANLYRELGGGEIVGSNILKNISSIASRHSDTEQLSIWLTNPTPDDTTIAVEIGNYPHKNAKLKIFDNLISDQPIQIYSIAGEILTYTFILPEKSSFLLVITP